MASIELQKKKKEMRRGVFKTVDGPRNKTERRQNGAGMHGRGKCRCPLASGKLHIKVGSFLLFSKTTPNLSNLKNKDT